MATVPIDDFTQLSEDEFAELFLCTRAQFTELALWKQQALVRTNKAAGLSHAEQEGSSSADKHATAQILRAVEQLSLETYVCYGGAKENRKAEAQRILQSSSEAVRSDRLVALHAWLNGAFEHVAQSLRTDKSVVLEAIASDTYTFAPFVIGWSIRGVDETLRADKEVMTAAIRRSEHCVLDTFSAASEALRDDEELVLLAIEHSTFKEVGDVLLHASRRLRDNKKVVLAAIAKEGSSGCSNTMIAISTRLQGDADVVAIAPKPCPLCRRYGCKNGECMR
jgi:hypothetical protein